MKKKKYICEECGNEYYSYHENSKFCSIDCKHNHNQIKHICDYCGKEHIIYRNEYEKLLDGTRKHSYCSKECKNKSAYTSVNKICKCCGKEFTIFNSEKDIQKFCSMDCYRTYKDFNSSILIKTCPSCNKTFKTYHKEQICCSKTCAGKLQMNRKKCICENCGNEFERIKSEVDKNKMHFCSKDCMYEYIRWNERDIDILKNNYRKIKLEQIQPLLSKEYSLGTIKSKAGVLGLQKSRLWSKDEEEFLFNNYSKIPMNEILKALPNRTLASIMGKVRNNNLLSYFYLNNVYSADDIKYLRNNYLEKTNEELANHLGRNVSGIEQKLWNLGLNRPYEIKKRRIC